MSHPIHNLVMESIIYFVLTHLRKELQIINDHFKTCSFLLVSPNFTWLKLQWHQMHQSKWLENAALLWSSLWKAHLHLSQRDFHIYTMLRCAKLKKLYLLPNLKNIHATSDHNYIMKRAWTFCRSHKGCPLPIRNTLKETPKKIYR
jgi:hypothetical protein